ncbi:Bacterial SH3 domain protein [Methyloligella halotolerans]|uniref:Bacterial SH3 domain protein n=1 Tax=Methyloligella halotolerans TaxID=1177755 RepID=A0A1E2RW41_9HYPH|nr:Bacterial SH3 domain protein [Methyloligella halotolerans]
MNRRSAAVFAGVLLIAALTALVVASDGTPLGAAEGKGSDSGLPVPRFVSLKADRVNVRRGPSTDQAISWVFSRAGLPVEIIAETVNWRRVRDSEGSDGWVFHSLLSGRRTALISPWAKESEAVPLYSRASQSAGVVAELQPNVLGDIESCDGEWCEIVVGDYSGYVQQELLWGAYRGEIIN